MSIDFAKELKKVGIDEGMKALCGEEISNERDALKENVECFERLLKEFLRGAMAAYR